MESYELTYGILRSGVSLDLDDTFTSYSTWLNDDLEDSLSIVPLFHPSRLPLPEAESAITDSIASHEYAEHVPSEMTRSDHGDQLQDAARSSRQDVPDGNIRESKTGIVRIHSRQVDLQSSKPVEITLERLAEHFHESLEVAAAKIGIGKSTMKLVCRRLGVQKWPYKQSRVKRVGVV
ncbi:hypothetical protein GUITHDRAFT_149835 [Guillardia theta CCMP2712]|uniref:RWP-RK domain-containing protein n=1 Tax=Guillardia theta (strain CCMP2712) TaxID=905079 RepID=L1K1J6_GUITC|nr:hypothetical protein GUITHDRAFT_149835 [Guillardia theta CCMP2712]EKX54716.1 hypothetical protein GUITHDRAFT_149835 [Guillardia theta CCMP2712]|eukprot:XP_005841696.1 hypothetical protein GUITHDRAFT_149835 [Guillardia theta CCMP2712]